MKNRTPRMRALTIGFVALLGAGVVATSCTAEEQLFMTEYVKHLNRQEQQKVARSQNSLSSAQLARLARCESGGNPRIVSSNGLYHGLYQFNQRTWNGIARQILPGYVGVRPSAAPVWAQDAMARKLYSQRGRQPWPVCGRRI